LAKKLSWSASRVRLAKVPAQYRRYVRPSSQASCCSCSNIVFIRFSRLASFAEVGFVCGNIMARWFVWLMRNRAARWVGLPPGEDSIRRVRSAKIALMRPIAGSSAEQPSIVLFMFKHCFHYEFTHWLRLRKLASFAEKYHCPLGSFGRIVYQVGRWVCSHTQTGRGNGSSRTNAPCWRGREICKRARQRRSQVI
jgi:hypothetical protein